MLGVREVLLFLVIFTDTISSVLNTTQVFIPDTFDLNQNKHGNIQLDSCKGHSEKWNKRALLLYKIY